MSIEFVISTFIAIIFGIPSIITLIKSYSRKIVYIQSKFLNLRNDLTKNIDDLRIYYDGNEINDNYYFVEGYLLLDGKKDVVKEDINKNISIRLDKDCIWHSFNTKETDDDMDVKYKIKKNKVEFDFDLLKRGEIIHFEGLFENLEKDYIVDDKSIIFKHRISNLPEIRKISTLAFENNFKSFFYFILTLILTWVTISEFIDVDSHNLKVVDKLTNEIVTKDEKKDKCLNYYMVLEEAANTNNLFDFLKPKTETYTLDCYKSDGKEYKREILIKYNYDFFFFLGIIIIILFVLVSAMFFIIFIQSLKYRKYSQLLEVSINK